MTIQAATPTEFRQKIVELRATSVAYKCGDNTNTVIIDGYTDEKIKSMFDACVTQVIKHGSSERFVPFIIDAYKDNVLVITAKWSVKSYQLYPNT